MNQSSKIPDTDLLAQIPLSPTANPPQLDIAALREEAARRILRRQLIIISIGAVLSLIAILLALFMLLHIGLAKGLWLLILPAIIICPVMLSGGAIALTLFIQRRKKEWP